MRSAVILACCLALLAGCQPSRKLRAARLDTAELLQSDPRYEEFSVQYLKQQTDIRQRLMEALQKAPSQAAKEKVAQKFTAEQKKLNDEWSEKTNTFLEARHERIRTTTQKICEAKEIDFVVIDSKYYPTVEWGAIDITQDVQLQLVESGQ